MNGSTRFIYTYPGRALGKLLLIATAMLSLSNPSAADTPSPPKDSTAPQEDFANTTLQQRIELRKKTKAHWRDPPAGDRAARTKREEAAKKTAAPDDSSSSLRQ